MSTLELLIKDRTDEEIAAISSFIASGMQHRTATEDALKELADEVVALRKEVQSLNDAAYKAGQDDVGGKLHKDIKDIDDVRSSDEPFDEALYNEAVRLAQLIKAERPNSGPPQVARIIRERTGDYSISKELSSAALDSLIAEFERMKVLLDIYE